MRRRNSERASIARRVKRLGEAASWFVCGEGGVAVEFGRGERRERPFQVFTRARARSSTRVGLAFEALEIAPLRLLGMEVPELPFKLRLDLPQLGLDLQRRLFGVADDKDPSQSRVSLSFLLFFLRRFARARRLVEDLRPLCALCAETCAA